MYKVEFFQRPSDIIEFLNANKIKKENIISLMEVGPRFQLYYYDDKDEN